MALATRQALQHGPPAFLLPCLHGLPRAAVDAARPVSRRQYARVVPPSAPSEASGSSSSSSSSTNADVGPSRSKAFSPNRSVRRDPDDDRSQWSFPTKPNPSPFEVMHLPRTAEPGEIKKQYYKLALLYHPDSSHPSSSPDHFQTLQKAYRLLTTPSARALYLRTGTGWSALGPDIADSGSGSSWADEEMRRQARSRGRGRGYPRAGEYGYGPPGAGGMGGMARGEAGYERMRWGYDADLGHGMGAQTEMGTGEGRYMSHPRFFGSLTILAVLFGLVQYNRALHATEMAREVVERRHVGASQALAEARQEAKLYGRERREQIRRIVRSMEVERDYEARMARAEASADGGVVGHGLDLGADTQGLARPTGGGG